MKVYCWVSIFFFVACSLKEENYSYREVYVAFWRELNTYYAYPQRIKVFNETPQDFSAIDPFSSERELSVLLGTTLDALHDGHAHLYTPWGILGNETYFSQYSPASIDDNSSYFESYKVLNANVRWGMVKNTTVAYLTIRSFDGIDKQFSCIDSLLSLWKIDTKGLIIDIRGNRGGNIEHSLRIASYFAYSHPIIGQVRRCLNGQNGLYSEWKNVSLSESSINIYLKPVVVLTDRFTFSAAEWFALALSGQPNTAIIGDTTGGGISVPLIRELPNGWLLSIPNTQFLDLNGRDIQFKGLPPDITVNSDVRLQNRDIPLEYAIDWLTTQTKQYIE